MLAALASPPRLRPMPGLWLPAVLFAVVATLLTFAFVDAELRKVVAATPHL